MPKGHDPRRSGRSMSHVGAESVAPPGVAVDAVRVPGVHTLAAIAAITTDSPALASPVPAAVAVALRAVVPNATVLLGGERRFRRTARPPRRRPPRVPGHLRRRASAMPMGNATCSEKHGARANSAWWTAVRHRVRPLSAKPSGHDTHVVVRYWSSLRSGPYDDLVHVDVGGLLDGEGDGAGDRIG